MSDKQPTTLVSKALGKLSVMLERQTSNIKRDEELVFFNTTAWLNSLTEEWNVPIHGWVYKPQSNWAIQTFVSEILERKFGLKANSETKPIFKRRLSLFTVDNERRKRVILELKGQLYELPKSKPNGQFEGIIKIPANDIKPDKDGLITFNAILKTADKRQFSGQSVLLAPQGISVISDIDDTVKHSYINDRKRMFDAAFFQEFNAIKGMPELYQKWAEQGAAFHFVSSSPWQLYQPLAEFMQRFNFPWASYSLKKVRIKDETFFNLFKSGLVTKPAEIEKILKLYPERKFILVGDSGEHDPQAYAKVAKEYPDQIIKIYIRNVHANKQLNQEYKAIFKGLNRRLWTTFVYPSQIKLNLNNL